MRIVHKIGDTFTYPCIYSDADADGVGIDLTGSSIKVQAKINPDSDVSLFDLAIGSGITVTDAVNGEFEMLVSDTTAWEIGIYQCDIQYTNASSIIESTETFEIEVIQDVTR